MIAKNNLPSLAGDFLRIHRAITRGLTVAAFNLLVQWNGLKPDDHGFIHLSIAEFSL